MANRPGRLGARRQGFRPDFVIGIQLGDDALAFYCQYVEEAGLVETIIGDRQVFDTETRSRWDLARGLALDGALKGRVLQNLPGLTSYGWD
ncbi:MAG: hypothetical protein R3335_14560 [Anaerolineales bacterium]|nr:hypothetical protein [Anaerolineales bacterium]